MVKEIALLLALLGAPSAMVSGNETDMQQYTKHMEHLPKAEINYQVEEDRQTYPLQKRDDGIMILPETEHTTGAYDVDELFAQRKTALNKRYAEMFELKDKIDKHRKESKELFRLRNEESKEMMQKYRALQRSYEKDMLSIIGDWAREKATNN